MGERTRGTVWCVRALLFAALLVGIVTMHTLGHPSPETAPSEPAPVSAQHADAGRHAGSAQHADAGQRAHTAQHADAGHVAPANGSSSHGDHGTGMDPMSVCLAVLGVWSAAALLGAAVVLALRATRIHDFLAPRRARILRALRPLPPPRTSTRLAQLSVLRI